eukprot:228193-Chlamydomonas_euryale.AAC.1
MTTHRARRQRGFASLSLPYHALSNPKCTPRRHLPPRPSIHPPTCTHDVLRPACELHRSRALVPRRAMSCGWTARRRAAAHTCSCRGCLCRSSRRASRPCSGQHARRTARRTAAQCLRCQRR